MGKLSNSYIEGANSIQLEISTKCNLYCPGCIRTNQGNFTSLNPAVPENKEMPLEVINSIVESEFGKSQLKRIEFCGVLDEPIAHSKFLEILKVLSESRANKNRSLEITIHTNASLRGESYFADLAKLMNTFHKDSLVRFSIDGIGHTHAIYRRNANYEKIIRNLKAFIKAEGKAIWQTLVFPWNAHQIEDMKVISKSLGCVGIYVRPDRTDAGTKSEKEWSEIRETAKREEFLKQGSNAVVDSLMNRLDEDVSCVFRDNQDKYFIAWDGRVWPCCFWPIAEYENQKKKELVQKSLYKKYGNDFNNLTAHPLDEILVNPFFGNDLVASWTNGSSLKWRCVEKCSIKNERASDGKKDDKMHLEQLRF